MTHAVDKITAQVLSAMMLCQRESAARHLSLLKHFQKERDSQTFKLKEACRILIQTSDIANFGDRQKAFDQAWKTVEKYSASLCLKKEIAQLESVFAQLSSRLTTFSEALDRIAADSEPEAPPDE